MKTIKEILPSIPVQMGSIVVKQPLPSDSHLQIDPFLLLHHAGPFEITPGENPMNVPAHPHRGFSPVTFVFNGSVAHRDSLGNEQIIHSGGIQWINAGAGIVHSESVSEEFIHKGGKFQIIQLWINLPQAKKMISPTYYGFDQSSIPKIKLTNGSIQLVAGNLHEKKGGIQPELPLTIFMGNLQAGDNFSFTVEDNYQAFVYVLEGKLEVNDDLISANQLGIIDRNIQKLSISSNIETKILFCAGEPLNETIKQYGPFVMNTQQEILQAMRDYENGEMGYLS